MQNTVLLLKIRHQKIFLPYVLEGQVQNCCRKLKLPNNWRQQTKRKFPSPGMRLPHSMLLEQLKSISMLSSLQGYHIYRVLWEPRVWEGFLLSVVANNTRLKLFILDVYGQASKMQGKTQGKTLSAQTPQPRKVQLLTKVMSFINMVTRYVKQTSHILRVPTAIH